MERWRTNYALGNLLFKAGRNILAKTRYRNAVEVVKRIGDGLTDPETKAGFLERESMLELFDRVEVG